MKYLKSFDVAVRIIPISIVLAIVIFASGSIFIAPAFGYGGGAVIIAIPPATNTTQTNLTENNLGEVAKKVDANKDSKINILDFNTLMVNWGNNKIANAADFNNDSKVDLFDFNLLMVHWQA